jgi:hypothetical protein
MGNEWSPRETFLVVHVSIFFVTISLDEQLVASVLKWKDWVGEGVCIPYRTLNYWQHQTALKWRIWIITMLTTVGTFNPFPKLLIFIHDTVYTTMSSPCARDLVTCESGIKGVSIMLKNIKDEALAIACTVSVRQDILGMLTSLRGKISSWRLLSSRSLSRTPSKTRKIYPKHCQRQGRSAFPIKVGQEDAAIWTILHIRSRNHAQNRGVIHITN